MKKSEYKKVEEYLEALLEVKVNKKFEDPLVSLIKEVLRNPIKKEKKDSCSCGCNSCGVKENQPQHSPENDPKPTIEPGTKEEPRPKRRTLRPPSESPNTKPKALTEKEKIIDLIVKKFQNLK